MHTVYGKDSCQRVKGRNPICSLNSFRLSVCPSVCLSVTDMPCDGSTFRHFFRLGLLTMGAHRNFSGEGPGDTESGEREMASAEREHITGIWAEPPAGSSGRASCQAVKGRNSIKQKALKHLYA